MNYSAAELLRRLTTTVARRKIEADAGQCQTAVRAQPRASSHRERLVGESAGACRWTGGANKTGRLSVSLEKLRPEKAQKIIYKTFSNSARCLQVDNDSETAS